MTAIELKAQVLALVEQEESLEKLEEVKALLSADEDVTDWERKEMTRRALQAEEDYKAGRVLTREQVEARIKNRLRRA